MSTTGLGKCYVCGNSVICGNEFGPTVPDTTYGNLKCCQRFRVAHLKCAYKKEFRYWLTCPIHRIEMDTRARKRKLIGYIAVLLLSFGILYTINLCESGVLCRLVQFVTKCSSLVGLLLLAPASLMAFVTYVLHEDENL